MGDVQVQGKEPALAVYVVSGDHFYRWAPEVVSCSTAVEVVPRQVADALADALEPLMRGNYGPRQRLAAREALAAYRRAGTNEETR